MSQLKESKKKKKNRNNIIVSSYILLLRVPENNIRIWLKIWLPKCYSVIFDGRSKLEAEKKSTLAN